MLKRIGIAGAVGFIIGLAIMTAVDPRTIEGRSLILLVSVLATEVLFFAVKSIVAYVRRKSD